MYYGEGVGKTTRGVGLAVRAAGSGLRVEFVQFMKSGTSGEVAVFCHLPNLHYRCPGRHPYILSRGPDTIHRRHADAALQFALKAAEAPTQVLICDEILNTPIFGLLTEEQILDLMDRCAGRIELILTGRKGPQRIIDRADYVTEFIQVKHPYYHGARARKGIEY